MGLNLARPLDASATGEQLINCSMMGGLVGFGRELALQAKGLFQELRNPFLFPVADPSVKANCVSWHLIRPPYDIIWS